MTRGGGTDAGEDHVRERGSAQRDAVGHDQGGRAPPRAYRGRYPPTHQRGSLPKEDGEDGTVCVYLHTLLDEPHRES